MFSQYDCGCLLLLFGLFLQWFNSKLRIFFYYWKFFFLHFLNAKTTRSSSPYFKKLRKILNKDTPPPHRPLNTHSLRIVKKNKRDLKMTRWNLDPLRLLKTLADVKKSNYIHNSENLANKCLATSASNSNSITN